MNQTKQRSSFSRLIKSTLKIPSDTVSKTQLSKDLSLTIYKDTFEDQMRFTKFIKHNTKLTTKTIQGSHISET